MLLTLALPKLYIPHTSKNNLRFSAPSALKISNCFFESLPQAGFQKTDVYSNSSDSLGSDNAIRAELVEVGMRFNGSRLQI